MLFARAAHFLLLTLTPCATVASPTLTESRSSCRHVPGDAGWPSARSWSQLNKTVEGRLIKVVPIASVCHDPTFASTECNYLKKNWQFSRPHVEAPADILAPYFQNQTCIPFTSKSTPCTLGNLASYSINVTGVKDIQAGIAFAKKNNVRLTIKNTGHDFLGKSTGKGALSLWTHHLQDVRWYDRYAGDGSYTGPAVRFGSGVSSTIVQNSLHSRGYRVLVGSCPTVGFAGGFLAGGGHGFLTSYYGLGADNVLAWEVVTAEGKHTTATPTKNRDLYWALSGGGAGTFAVAVSVTVRAYPDKPLSAVSTGFNATAAGGTEKFWKAVARFQANLGPVVDKGVTVAYLLAPALLAVQGFVIPDGNLTTAKGTLEPLRAAMEKVNVSLELNLTSHDNYQDMYKKYFVEVFSGIPEAQITGGRMIPRKVIEDAKGGLQVANAFRAAVEAGFTLICVGFNAAKKRSPSFDNAVFPLWRSSLLHCIVSRLWDFDGPWDDMIAAQEKLTNVVMSQLEAASPGGGAYLNEANFQQKGWEKALYGDNYGRLSRVKKVWDPSGLLYARTAVGSELWGEDAGGRLCKK